MYRTAILRSAVTASRALGPATMLRRSTRLVAATTPSTSTTTRATVAAVTPSFQQALRMYSSGGSLKKEEVEGRIMSLLHGFDGVKEANNIKPAAHFANDLGLDSLDTVEVVMAIEEEFSIEIPEDDANSIHSVDKAVEYILSQPDAH